MVMMESNATPCLYLSLSPSSKLPLLQPSLSTRELVPFFLLHFQQEKPKQKTKKKARSNVLSAKKVECSSQSAKVFMQLIGPFFSS